ncbi:hypothetical protein [Vulcanisaeta sp. JCM 16159]
MRLSEILKEAMGSGNDGRSQSIDDAMARLGCQTAAQDLVGIR